MASKRMTITIPEGLAQELEQYRDVINVSGICARALVAEIRMRAEKRRQLDPPSNGGIECDADESGGPCSCGAWHDKEAGV